MHYNQSTEAHEAYARLALRLCDALSQFLAATTGDQKASSLARCSEAANDDEPVLGPISDLLEDPMTLEEVQFELRLKEKQIVMLRRLWEFPSPRLQDGKLAFSRREVERWARMQPNPNNFAAVLRLRRRRLSRVAEKN